MGRHETLLFNSLEIQKILDIRFGTINLDVQYMNKATVLKKYVEK